MTTPEDTWDRLEALGRVTGHVLCRCPVCTSRVMVSILNASGTSRWLKSGGGWPPCKQCRAGSPLGRKKRGVRVEPIGDVSLVARVRPGYPPGWRRPRSKSPKSKSPEAKGSEPSE